jgi:glucose/arabinose dehydrogenase
MARRVAWLVVALVTAGAAPLTAQLATEIVVRGLTNPVAVIADPLDTARLLVVEQRGQVRVVEHGVLLDEPFLDVRVLIATGGERGLLGLALAPDYVDSRRLFVNFTNREGHTVVARYLRSEEQPRRADPASRFDLVWPGGQRFIDQPFSNHNGGHLAFGPDGNLYIGLGDGGSGGDPLNHAQRPESLLGKMLRIDVHVDDDDARGYRIPADNPFAGDDRLRALDEIWAFGLRNPWRYSFDDPDRGGTSALLVADVGQNAREEINFEPANRGGRNYGWRLREGRQPYDDRTPPALLPLAEPIHDYGRALGGSVTGGLIYRGTALDPSFEGRYWYADFISGRVFSIGLHLDDDGAATADDERDHTASLGGRDRLGMVSSFGADHAGELLVVNYTGSVVRITPDFSVVPTAPLHVAATFGAGRASLRWSPAASSVPAADYAVERVRNNRVTERFHVARTQLSVDAEPGDCFRVRARAASGVMGPADATRALLS